MKLFNGEYFMRRALHEAEHIFEEDEIPPGKGRYRLIMMKLR
jgi:hypothetical protein